jgi:integrase
MARPLGKLTALQVQRAKPGKYHDGGGLYLLVHPGGSRSWAFRYGPGGNRYCGLGPTHTISLATARGRARECRELLIRGIDPLAAKREHKTAAKLADAKALTFAEAADRYFASHRAGWRSDKHAKEWRATLAIYADPYFGNLPIAAIDVSLVLKALEPIWTTKADTAGRVRQRIEAVLDWAKARGYRTGENPARWRGHLDHLLPAQKRVARVKHFHALPYAEIGAFMAKLRAAEGIAPRCAEFISLTAARLGEAINAEWSEIDLDHRVWTVPASRMKAGREHRVPLSDPAIAVLTQVAAIRRRDSNFVFPGNRRGRPVGETAVWLLVKEASGDEGATVHGLRSTFRDWAAERTNYAREVCEMALAHIVADDVERAYRRGDLFDKRQRLMEEWGRFCAAPAAKGGVVALRHA